MKEFKVKQNLMLFLIPGIIDLTLIIIGILSTGIARYIFLGVAAAFLGLIIYQARPIFRNYCLILTPREIKILDLRGKTVRKVDWKKVEGVAAGYKKLLFIYMYSFYFRVKGEEDTNFLLNSRQVDLSQKLKNFVKVFVRRNIPVQVVKP